MNAIWKRPVTVGQGLDVPQETMGARIGLQVVEVGEEFLRGTLQVDHRTVQHVGMLHGGASCALAEELGSIAANLCLPPDSLGVGVEINASHLRGATKGVVTGTARPLRIGNTLQTWEIRIENASRELLCIARLTVSVIQRPGLGQ